MESKIKSIRFLGVNTKGNRRIKIKMTSGSTITIEACHESWEQWGGYQSELFETMPIAEKYNEWLHGGEMPC